MGIEVYSFAWQRWFLIERHYCAVASEYHKRGIVPPLYSVTLIAMQLMLAGF